MNVVSMPASGPVGEGMRPTVPFPRFTFRDLLIEIFYHKKLMVLAFIVPVVLGLLAASAARPSYTAQARLLVLYGSEYFYRPLTGQSTSSSIPLDRNEIMSGELQVVQSQTLAMETIQKVGLGRVYPGLNPADPNALAQAALRFERDLNATSIAQSNVLDLSFRSYNPDVSADVLKALITTYLERRIAVFARPSSSSMQTDQDNFQDRLRKAEDTLTQFSVEHGIGNLEQQMTLLLTQQSTNRTAQDEAAGSISEAAAKLAAVQAQIPKVPTMVPVSAQTDRAQRVQLLTAELTQLQIRRREMGSRYQPGAPAYAEVDRNIAALQSQVGQGSSRDPGVVSSGRNPVAQDLQTQQVTLQAQLDGLKARQADLQAAADSIAGRVKELSQAAPQYRDLVRDRDVLDQTYRALVRSNEDTQIADTAERSRAANIRVVQPPERPAVGRNLSTALAAAGVGVGIVAAIAALAVANALKANFVTARDVTVALELPVLVGVARGRSRGLFQSGRGRAAARARNMQMPGMANT